MYFLFITIWSILVIIFLNIKLLEPVIFYVIACENTPIDLILVFVTT